MTTLLIQHIETIWTKRSRGGDGARARNAVPETLELPAPPGVRPFIPVMESLGWKLDSTVGRQVPMRIKVGSGKSQFVLADFVGYSGALTSQALLVVEAKRKIGSTTELATAKEQAESYALKRRCGRFAVASPEGIWVYGLSFPGESRQLASIEIPAVVRDRHQRFNPKPFSSRLVGLIDYDSLRSSVDQGT